MSKKVEVTEFKTKKIEKSTGGKIGSYRIPDYPGDESDGELHHSFLTKDGKYIGDYDRAWWYVKHNLKVCEDYPHGVAERHEGGKLIGYYGYTHRGGQTFKIGDRLFDEKYVPVESDFEAKQWKEWKDKYDKAYANGDDFDRENIYDTISSVIPFRFRGNIIISSMNNAKQAAINVSKYLS